MPKPKDPVFRRLGGSIRAERKRLGISQEDLALQAEINRTYMGGVERGEENISVASLLKISGVLKTKPSVLLAKGGL